MIRAPRFTVAVAVAALVWLTPAPWMSAQDVVRPNDETPPVELIEGEGERGTDAIQDKPTARLQWQIGAWGPVTPEFRANAMKEGKNHTFKKNAPGPKWVNIGPTDAKFEQNGGFTGKVRDAGRARTILPHPTDENIVYFLSSGGGLWRTNNWMSTDTQWTVLTDDLPTTGGGSVAFGRNPNTLYLGLGDPYDRILVGGSVTRSKNGGNSWDEVIELGNAISVRDVKVDTTTNRDIVMVATNSGLYRSADNGDTYSAVPTFANLAVWSLARTSAGWLASAQPCPAPGVDGLQCPVATTLYLSTDRGATWAPISNAGNVFSNNGRTTLGVAVPGDSVVYAYSASVGDGVMRDVYRSADGGQTWVANGVNSTKTPLNPIGLTNMNICAGQCWYNQSIVVDPRDTSRNTVWIGGTLAAAVSTDGGSSWSVRTWWLYSQNSLPYAHADHHAAAFKLTGTPTLILGNDGGMNISTDDGLTFSSDKNRGMANHLFYSISGNPKLPNLVIGGTQDNGTRLRLDNSTTYNQVIGGDGMGAAHSQDNTNTLIGSSQGSNMRTSLINAPNAFQNWLSAVTGLSDVGFGFFTAVVAAPGNLDPTGRVFFHFSSARVWRTNNGGLNWNLIGSAVGVPSPGIPPARRFRSTSYNLGVSPQDLNRIAVGAAGGFIDITTNGGASWQDIDLLGKGVPAPVPPGGGFQGFISNVTWADNQTIWVAATNATPGAIRVIKGTIANPGDPWSTATWTAKQNGLPDLPITRVYVDPKDATLNTLLAATHVGIYRTTDGGDNWAPYGNGLPTVRVHDIYMPPDGSFVRIATYGRSIWELSQLELVGTELSDQGSSCDADGTLDDGETGRLTVTFRNQGPNNVNHLSVTVTSTNPRVSFPNGNTVAFPPAGKNSESTGFIAVALNGASGIDVADFKISVEAPELSVPAFNVEATHRMNYDTVANASNVDTFESPAHGWVASGDAATDGNINNFQRRAVTPLQHVLWGPDNNGFTDGDKPVAPDQQMMVSPPMLVGAGPLSITLRHRFSFDGTLDGGVIEITKDGGATWADAGTGAYTGTTSATTNAPIGASRPAFVNRSVGWPNTFIVSTANLGTAYAGETVQLRLRVGANTANGAPGWDVDEITVDGLANTPFTALVPETGACTP
jgi:hypothetical protein